MKKRKKTILYKILFGIVLVLIVFLPLRYKRFNCICLQQGFVFDCCDRSEWALFWGNYPLTNRKRYYEIQKNEQDFVSYFPGNED